jgi:hypothetical protein
LNRYRERDFRHAFDKYFEVISWKLDGPVGRELLTPTVQAELSDYSEDDLLSPNVVVLAQRK